MCLKKSPIYLSYSGRNCDTRMAIDTGGWSGICGALFNETPIKYSVANHYTLDIVI